MDTAAILRCAKLPVDLFSLEDASLSPAEYFQFWEALEQVAGEQEVALLFAQHLSAESFDPPIFASMCSPDLNTALKRISYYKPLVGPMILDVAVNRKDTRLNIHCYGYEQRIPSSLGMIELVFFTQLSRIATRSNIQPLAIEVPNLPNKLELYIDYFGCDVVQGNEVSIRFSAEDAKRPFLTSSAPMWEFFESKLNQKLADLDSTATTVERVRAVLLEALPSGYGSIESVADKLAMSKRTLQRKLTSEADSFQSVLQSVRAELADHYLESSKLSLSEIAFLIGFRESNSFIRAYSVWKGVSPGYYREQCHQEYQ
ncbi:MAG: AraC family transcriptional regulator ligand-binding domain-containing protein [Flavobacteriales bacterium]|nr:AraC family transcriptional regulator ligand-binding domain-containing protein [Flavobacteriales bacterium]